jgi:hypothetical protein
MQERDTESANPRRRPQTNIEAAVAAVPRPSHPLPARCRSPRTSPLPTEAATTIHGGAPSSSLRGDGGPKDDRNFFEARTTFLTPQRRPQFLRGADHLPYSQVLYKENNSQDPNKIVNIIWNKSAKSHTITSAILDKFH